VDLRLAGESTSPLLAVAPQACQVPPQGETSARSQYSPPCPNSLLTRLARLKRVLTSRLLRVPPKTLPVKLRPLLGHVMGSTVGPVGQSPTAKTAENLSHPRN
jgi:hypothetical protein